MCIWFLVVIKNLLLCIKAVIYSVFGDTALKEFTCVIYVLCVNDRGETKINLH